VSGAENLRARAREEGWPTPNHLREAGDALNQICAARYGSVLKAIAELLDPPESPVLVRREDFDALLRATREHGWAPSELHSVIRALIDNADVEPCP
jgi:hypothetical protein